MGDIWWDIFCPKCDEGIGGTCNTEEELKEQLAEVNNKMLTCSQCGHKWFNIGDE